MFNQTKQRDKIMYQEIPLHKLRFSPTNVRVVNPDKKADAELVASIANEGLLQNLVVVPVKQFFEVVAGGRRLAAFHVLLESKNINRDALIGCEVKSATDNLTAI